MTTVTDLTAKLHEISANLEAYGGPTILREKIGTATVERPVDLRQAQATAGYEIVTAVGRAGGFESVEEGRNWFAAVQRYARAIRPHTDEATADEYARIAEHGGQVLDDWEREHAA